MKRFFNKFKWWYRRIMLPFRGCDWKQLEDLSGIMLFGKRMRIVKYGKPFYRLYFQGVIKDK